MTAPFAKFHVDGYGDVEFLDYATPDLWRQWNTMIATERWSGDDDSMRALTPDLGTTKCVFARRISDGKFSGTVTWNESDGVAFIGIFLVHPEVRGKGIGHILFNRAIERIPPEMPQLLRSVPHMTEFYKRRNNMNGTQKLHEYCVPCMKLIDLLKSKADEFYNFVSVRSLSDAQLQKLLEYDKFVTGRDRSDFLLPHFKLSFVDGLVLFDEKGDVIAMGSIGPTNLPEDHLYKVAPIYALNSKIATALALSLAECIAKKDAEAKLLFLLLEGFRGDDEFAPFFEKHGIEPRFVGTTLCKGDFENSIRTDVVYVVHNNSGHFDA